MDFNKDDVSKFIKRNEMPYRSMWTAGMTLIVWVINLLLFMSDNIRIYSTLILSIYWIVNILVTISTVIYIKRKSIYFQNLNLSALMLGLSCFAFFSSLNFASVNKTQNIFMLMFYFAIIISSALLSGVFILKGQVRSSNKKNRTYKQNTLIGSSGAVFLYSLFRLLGSFVNADDVNLFNLIISLFGAIFMISMSTNYFLKAYLIKKYDLDEPVKIIEE